MTKYYLCSFNEKDEKLSYYADWKDAFQNAGFTVLNFEVDSPSRIMGKLANLRAADIIVFGHSFFYRARNRYKKRPLPFFLRKTKAAKVFFMENEYRLFREKTAMAEALGCQYIATQFPKDVGEAFYTPHLNAKVLAATHALNPAVFNSTTPHTKRANDIGNREFAYPLYTGNTGREVASQFEDYVAEKTDLTLNTTKDRGQRFNRQQWAAFLGDSRVMVSAEAGMVAIDFDDTLRGKINDYQAAHPDATMQEVAAKFFAPLENPLPGLIMAPRHFDAAGSRTAMVLVEGRYNDVLAADTHYIPLKVDLSNKDAVLEKVKDPTYTQALAARTHAHIMANHTHAKRVHQLLKEIGA